MTLQDYTLRASESNGESFAVGLQNVTVVAYFFRERECYDAKFVHLRGALLETWRKCGFLKTVVVTNRKGGILERFVGEFPWVKIQVEEKLVPGCIDSMSIDCNAELWRRFDTDYVLIVQDDGFPLRSGLERFVGKFDFVGAPWRRANIRGVLAGFLSHCWPSNGGFSLRSRRLCKMVAERWRREWSLKPFDRPTMQEDIFYTQTLPRADRAFARSVRWANSFWAADFSYDCSVPQHVNRRPFGFHGAEAFHELMRNNRVFYLG